MTQVYGPEINRHGSRMKVSGGCLPFFSDELRRCQALEGLEPSGVDMSVDERQQVAMRLVMVVGAVAFDGRAFDRSFLRSTSPLGKTVARMPRPAECGFAGRIGRSVTVLRFRHGCTVVGWTE